MKSGPERELVDRYLDRTRKSGTGLGIKSVDILEHIEGRARSAAQRKREEADTLRNRLPSDTLLIALDEHGKQFSSRDLASLVEVQLASGTNNLAFLIGGADGLDPDLLNSASHKIAFGKITLPHQIVRMILLEQLYRSVTILLNHPYHRD